jgi:hypothetical protein
LPSTVVLGASKDNTLYQSTLGDISNGAGDSFFAGLVGSRGGSAIRRGLLAFDIADNIPAGSTINSVTLTLYMSQSRSGAETVELRDVLADWGEGTSVGTGMGPRRPPTTPPGFTGSTTRPPPGPTPAATSRPPPVPAPR